MGLKSVVAAGIRKVQAIRARGEIARLAEISAPCGTALRNALSRRLDADEAVWVERIESARRELLRSTDTIAVDDYGAVSPEHTLSGDEMAQGRVYETVIGDLCRACSKPYFWSLLLFELIRQFRPVHCVELGTCVGISAAYQGAALALNGQGGSLVTIEGSQQTADVARRNLHGLGLATVAVTVGRFQDVLPTVLAGQRPVDYVFVDGHHDQEATVQYFEVVCPYLSATAVVVFDDISWSAGMREAWERIAADPRINLAVDLGAVGVCVVGAEPSSATKRSGASSVRIPLI